MEQDKTGIIPILQVSKLKFKRLEEIESINRQEQGPAPNYFAEEGTLQGAGS